MRVVVCGYMIRHPLAGNMLAYFQYLLGLARLGHDVAYLEESGWREPCYQPDTDSYSDDPAFGIRALERLMARFGAAFPVHYVDRAADRGGDSAWRDAIARADLLLNLGGVCWLDEFRLCRRLVLVDMDPFFTQVGKLGLEGLADYDAHFSYGSNIGLPGCTIPTGGIPWRPMVPPVAPEIWKPAPRPGPRAPLTTIANWNAYGEAVHEGEAYGQKDREIRRFAGLPALVDRRLELAIGGATPATMEELRAAGWSVRDALEVSADVADYQSYIAASRGELSLAKHGYVKSRSGWFSDRSVCYMASGRPVILQDTGFSEWLPTGRGVLAFSTPEEAAERVARLDADYAAHCRAAREIAERTFHYANVLPRLLDTAIRDREGAVPWPA